MAHFARMERTRVTACLLCLCMCLVRPPPPLWLPAGDGSTLACSKASCMALAVGVVTRFRIIGDLITTRESTLADARRAIDTNPRFRDAVPEKCVGPVKGCA